MLWNTVEDVQRGLYVLVLLILGIFVLLVVTLVTVLWGRYASLSPPAKLAIGLLIGAVALYVALVVGWIGFPVIKGYWEAAVVASTHTWYRFDTFTRKYPWVGMLLVALLPLLASYSDSYEIEYEPMEEE